MKNKESEFDKFDQTMKDLLSVPHSVLQEKLDEEKRAKAAKKKRSNASSSDRVAEKRT
jgi:hypothetical protein